MTKKFNGLILHRQTDSGKNGNKPIEYAILPSFKRKGLHYKKTEDYKSTHIHFIDKFEIDWNSGFMNKGLVPILL